MKARAIMHAHLGRIELNPDTLDKDRQIIVQKCPYLIQEMVSCVNQLIMLAYARRSEYEKRTQISNDFGNFGRLPLFFSSLFSLKAAKY